jgi:putative Holliday junction resolvase
LGRILAIDVGKKRTGIAVTDPLKLIASGLTTVPTHRVLDFIADYLKRESIEQFVVGMPVQMNNQPSEAVKWVQPLVDKLKKQFSAIPVQLVDERFTSKIAMRTMIDGGLKKTDRQNKSLVDTISATIILQSYMESLEYKKQHGND